VSLEGWLYEKDYTDNEDSNYLIRVTIMKPWKRRQIARLKRYLNPSYLRRLDLRLLISTTTFPSLRVLPKKKMDVNKKVASPIIQQINPTHHSEIGAKETEIEPILDRRPMNAARKDTILFAQIPAE
jgi:hypothetical protein